MFMPNMGLQVLLAGELGSAVRAKRKLEQTLKIAFLVVI
jgi:hypothetical protein